MIFHASFSPAKTSKFSMLNSEEKENFTAQTTTKKLDITSHCIVLEYALYHEIWVTVFWIMIFYRPVIPQCNKCLHCQVLGTHQLIPGSEVFFIFTEWVLHWISTSLNEYFTEWVLPPHVSSEVLKMQHPALWNEKL